MTATYPEEPAEPSSSPDNGAGGSIAVDTRDGAATADLPAAAALASRYGLEQSALRPGFGRYLKELWYRRHFIFTFARSKSISRHAGNQLGGLWQVLTPLANAAVYYLIFGLLLGVSRGVQNYIPFLITGVFVFTYIQRTVSSGARAISGNLGLIRALHFPRACLPLAVVLVELQQLLISMVLLSGIVVATGEPLTAEWLMLIPVLMLMTLFNIGLSMIMARIGAFVADITQLLPFITRVWLYSSGIIFTIPDRLGRANFPDWVGYALMANPGSVYIELARNALMTSYPESHHMMWPLWVTWVLAAAWALVALIFGFWFFWRAEEKYGRG